MPGLLAPASLKIGGKQYVAAFFADGTYVLPPNSVPGLTSRDAKPGDTIVLYGIGFGPVVPVAKAVFSTVAIVQFQNKLYDTRAGFCSARPPAPWPIRGSLPALWACINSTLWCRMWLPATRRRLP